MGMKATLLICAVVMMGQSVMAADKEPLIADPIVEKVMELHLENNPELDLPKDISEAQDLSRQNPMETERLPPC